MKGISMGFIMLFFIQQLSAGATPVKGIVTDRSTKEPLESAVIKNLRSMQMTRSDKNGHFELTADPGDSLVISFIGYATTTHFVNQAGNINIGLEKAMFSLKNVTISGGNRLETFKALSSLDLNMQPVKSAQDMLRLVPGLLIAQHMGGGKAEQIFLRGFDADHGTDININVDGIPVNLVSHVHCQGYADMHFLIPETIGSYDFGKGPYYTEKGDFTTAGFVDYTTKNSIGRSMLKMEAGEFNTFRAVTMLNLLNQKATQKGQHAYIAAEGLFSDGGPFKLAERFSRYNIFGKYTAKIGVRSQLAGSISWFTSGWRASGELPDRTVSEGYASSRFGVIDSSQGGHTSRFNASIKITTDLGNKWLLDNQLYFSRYHFNLVSNFTYFYYYPDEGDEFRQKEKRDLLGYNGKLSKTTIIDNTHFTLKAGIGVRYDHIDPLETQHTIKGQFLGYYGLGKANELNTNGWLEESIEKGKWLLNAGVRFDYFHFAYQNLLSKPDTVAILPYAGKAVFSPKFNIVYSASQKLQLYVKTGKGFHSNDTRVVILNKGLQVLPSAYGVDLGINWKPLSNFYINTALWYLYLQQEFTYGQDLSDQLEGPVSPSGKTVRMGVDVSARYQFNSWLFANANINLSRPRYVDSAKGKDYIDLAPTFTSTGGLDFRLRNGLNGGISYRYLHRRAANNDYSLTALGYFITDLSVNYTRRKYELGITIENLLNRTWNESQISYLSRFKNEPVPVEEVSYTPGVPFFANLSALYFSDTQEMSIITLPVAVRCSKAWYACSTV